MPAKIKSIIIIVLNSIMDIVFYLTQFLRYILDLLVDSICGLFYYKKRMIINPPKSNLVLRSASSLARGIKEERITCEQVVQAFIDRINEINPILNAVVDNRFHEALEEAVMIDEQIAKGEISDAEFLNKPLLGIPFTSKESTHCKGLAVTFGLKKRIKYKATFDADCVAAIKNAGGILLGVTNIPQLNLWQETINPVYGLTKNPYDTTKTVGGSAGGEACSLAACGTPIGLGTDLGGSSRIPAFMCGIFGHKLSSDLVGVKGMTYRDGSEINSIIVPGAMTKYAEDLVPLVKALAGKNAVKLNLDSPVNISHIKVYYITNPRDRGCSPITNDIQKVLLRAVKYFSKISSEKPEELSLNGLRCARILWSYAMSLEPNKNFKNDINNREGEINAFKEIVKHFTIGGDYTLGTMLNIINDTLPKINAKGAKQEIDTLKNSLLSKLGENSVLLYPSAPLPARHHYTAFCRPYNFNFFSIWNVLRFPATQVPMGIGIEGVPIGIQVIAAPYQDRLCLAVAKELEKEFGGWVPPFVPKVTKSI